MQNGIMFLILNPWIYASHLSSLTFAVSFGFSKMIFFSFPFKIILLIFCFNHIQNHGEEISLRLRTDDLKGFRKYDSIKKTLLHELVGGSVSLFVVQLKNIWKAEFALWVSWWILTSLLTYIISIFRHTWYILNMMWTSMLCLSR